MQSFSSSPLEMVRSFWRNRGLIWALTKREVLGRYRGSVMGILWSFFNPLLMLGVYTFVFSTVFKARWAGGSDSKTEFALLLFAGMLVFGIFSECANRAPSLILTNPNSLSANSPSSCLTRCCRRLSSFCSSGVSTRTTLGINRSLPNFISQPRIVTDPLIP
jgi:ABC-type polysaccharide/polyol phosphate export permease